MNAPADQAPLSEARMLYGATPSWRAHLLRYLGALACALGALGALIAYFATSPHIGLIVGAAVASAVGLWLYVGGELRRRATHYRITTRTIDVEQGVLSKRIDTLQLWRVRDVMFEQSLSERMLGIGRIRVITHDRSSPDLILQGLPDARALFEKLKLAVEGARREGNVLGMVE